MNETDQQRDQVDGAVRGTSASGTATPGQCLAAAREAQGLSPRAVATHLNLPVATVEALEADDFERLPPATFVRGYLRAYARLLELDAEEVIAAYEDLAPDQAAGIHIHQPLPDPSRKQSHAGTWVVAGGIAVALAAAGLVWFQGVDENDAPRVAESRGAEGEAPPIVVERTDTREPAADTDDEAAELRSLPRLEAVPDATPDTSVDERVAARSDPPAEERSAFAALSDEPVEYDPLVIRVNWGGEAWIEVDAGEERLLRELVVGPRTLEFTQSPEYRVVIGDVRYVDVNFSGEAVNLRPHTSGRVARFDVTAADVE